MAFGWEGGRATGDFRIPVRYEYENEIERAEPGASGPEEGRSGSGAGEVEPQALQRCSLDLDLRAAGVALIPVDRGKPWLIASERQGWRGLEMPREFSWVHF
jgi:hypothetical protein